MMGFHHRFVMTTKKLQKLRSTRGSSLSNWAVDCMIQAINDGVR